MLVLLTLFLIVLGLITLYKVHLLESTMRKQGALQFLQELRSHKCDPNVHSKT